MPLLREIQRDLDAATASWLASRKVDRPEVVSEFWRHPDLPLTLEKTATDLGVSPDRALMPASWRLWLSQLSLQKYQLAKASPQHIGVAESFFAALRAAPESALWLAKAETLPSVQPRRVGLLDVIPGVVRLAWGEAPLLWLDESSVWIEEIGRVAREREREVFDVVRKPAILGRTRLEASDADEATTHLSEQFTLLRSVDLAQTADMRGEFCWTKTPPLCLWRGAADAAAYYVLAKLCELDCVPATAAFTNPSTSETCCVQEVVVGVVGESDVNDPEAAALDWLLGAEGRSRPVVDSAGRLWCVGPVRLGGEVLGDPPAATWPTKVDPERLLAAATECGLDPDLLGQRLAALRSVASRAS